MTDFDAAAAHGRGIVYPQAGNRLFQGIEDGAYFTLFTALRDAGRLVDYRPVQLRRAVLPRRYRKNNFFGVPVPSGTFEERRAHGAEKLTECNDYSGIGI